jgi:hypothetical protein
MSKKPTKDTSFADLVARLNAMSNMTPAEERASLMEAARQEPRILDQKEVTLADIAKLAGIKEYVEPVKVSPKAEQLVESIVSTGKSDITRAIEESDADTSIKTTITKTVTEESKRLDKIAELEAQLAELKAQEKTEATLDDKSFRETFVKEITDFVKEADANKLAELYNSFSANEVEIKEDNFLIKTPETKQIIADAEKAEAKDEAVVQEEPAEETPAEEPAEEAGGYEGQDEYRKHTIKLAGDFDPESPVTDADAEAVKKEIMKNSAEQGIGSLVVDVEPAEGAYDSVVVHTMRDRDEIIGYLGDMVEENLEIEYTNDLSETKKPVPTSPEKWSQAKSKAKAKFDVYPSAYANAWASKEYKKMGGGWRMGKKK